MSDFQNYYLLKILFYDNNFPTFAVLQYLFMKNG